MGSFALITTVLVLVALEIAFEIVVVKLSIPIFESRPPMGAELFPADLSAEPVAISTRDGLRLAGSLMRASHDVPRGLILFCHELDSNRWSALSYCEGLLAAGFHVLTFDFRNQGDSQALSGYSPMHWATVFEVEDVKAAVAFVESRPDLCGIPLGIFGMSRGGSVALAAAAECDSIRCVASDGAFACFEMLLHYTTRWGTLYFPDRVLRSIPRWHVQFSLWLVRRISELRLGFKYANVERALSKLHGKPVLMISGERDNYVIPEITERLFARTRQSSSHLWIVPQAKHNMARQTFPEEYDGRLIDFFSILDSAGADFSARPVACSNPSLKGVINGGTRPALLPARSLLSRSN